IFLIFYSCRSTLPNVFPYTTLFRSLSFTLGSLLGIIAGARPGSVFDRFFSVGSLALYAVPSFWLGLVLIIIFAVQLRWLPTSGRSEEHTSELQSRENLVCRLLLEKK